MRFRYEAETGKPSEVLADGSMLEICAAIGKLMRTLWFRMSEGERIIFKLAIQAVMSDESPTWTQPSGTFVDASELLRMQSSAGQEGSFQP